MGRHPDVVEVLKQVLRNPVVEDALALDHLVFLGIERGRIVLEVLDQGSRLRAFVKDLGLAFINAASTAHWDVPCVVEIHEFGVLRMTRDCDPRRSCREGQERETEREPGLVPTYLIGLSSTIDRSLRGEFYPCRLRLKAGCLNHLATVI
jgi:hypothetical protein